MLIFLFQTQQPTPPTPDLRLGGFFWGTVEKKKKKKTYKKREYLEEKEIKEFIADNSKVESYFSLKSLFTNDTSSFYRQIDIIENLFAKREEKLKKDYERVHEYLRQKKIRLKRKKQEQEASAVLLLLSKYL